MVFEHIFGVFDARLQYEIYIWPRLHYKIFFALKYNQIARLHYTIYFITPPSSRMSASSRMCSWSVWKYAEFPFDLGLTAIHWHGRLVWALRLWSSYLAKLHINTWCASKQMHSHIGFPCPSGRSSCSVCCCSLASGSWLKKPLRFWKSGFSDRVKYSWCKCRLL